jgi:magnesium-transporting ATPase (P-type)
VRRLTQPSVVKAAALAALASTVLSLPRMLLWEKRPYLTWYIESILFCCGFVMWAFVFAWHTEYTHRPLFTLRIKPMLFASATVVGIIAGLGHHWLLDPSLRPANPEDYPVDFRHWVAQVLFTLSFNQLFLLFAPFAWAMRLFRNERVATWVIVAFGVLVLALKTDASPLPQSALLILALATLQIASAFFGVWFYLRGGIFLAWWIAFLVEARHLLTFGGL